MFLFAPRRKPQQIKEVNPMFMLKEIDAAQADATEMNCDSGDCRFWLPTSWCEIDYQVEDRPW